MQLIQLHSFHHGEKDAADSTAFFFFHSGGAAWGRSAQAPPEWKKKLAVESAAKFLMKKTWQLNQLPNFHIFYYETYFLFRNEEYMSSLLFISK